MAEAAGPAPREEADTASSDADFLARMRIALREIKEAHVALGIITRCRMASHEHASALVNEANQLASIFFTIVKNKARSLPRSSLFTKSEE